MQKVILFLFLYFIGFQSINAQCYQLVWEDNFVGTALDLTKWTPIVGEGGAVSGNAELQYYTSRPENIEVSSGTLKIKALLENYGGNNYTSARMQTKNLGDWLYGKFEARIKLPTGVGMWPAFWMLPTNNEYGIWPRSGEMDVTELIGIEPNRTYGTIHTYNSSIAVQSFGGSHTLSTGVFSNAFHIFTLEWSPTEIKIFVDGILYFTKTTTTISPYPWVFDKQFYMLLNLAIGGSWAGPPNGSTVFPQIMEVDYVKVFQKINDIAINGRILIEPNTANEIYSVPNISGMTYQWSVSGSGNSIVSGQNTNQIAVNWGNNSGVVAVLLNNLCSETATISKNISVTPNLWSNPNFEYNYQNWETRPNYNSNVNFEITTINPAEGLKSSKITVNTSGSNPWDYQLSRTNLNLQNGVNYTISFQAKSNANRTIPIAFIRSSDFGQVFYQTINLTTNWQNYSYNFTPSATVNAMFNADIATQTGIYYFDNFSFAKTQSLPIQSIENELDSNIIYPNPSEDFIYINVENRNFEMELYDSVGKLIFKEDKIPIKLNINQLENGLYLLKIENKFYKIIKK